MPPLPSYPGSSIVYAMGNNNNGQVVGSYDLSGSGPFGFLYDSNTNTYTTISNPGWYNIQLTGINDSGQMVGYYEDTQATWHGFIATPQ